MLKTMSFAQKTQEEWIANLVNKVMSPSGYAYRDGNTYQIKRELCCDDKAPDMVLKSRKMQEYPQEALIDFVEEIGYYADDYNEYIPQSQFLNCGEISDAGKRFIEENWDAVEQWMHEHIFYFYDPADFENQEVCVNLVLATDLLVIGNGSWRSNDQFALQPAPMTILLELHPL